MFNGKNGGIDIRENASSGSHANPGSPFYDVSWGNTSGQALPNSPSKNPHIEIKDTPFMPDSSLRKNDFDGEFKAMFYTFVVCVKNNGQDRILLSGLKWGYKRSYTKGLGGNKAVPIEPECTGLKSFPRGEVQDAINGDTALGEDPTKGGYNYKDEWVWDR
jgi:hypothetical protein